LTLTGNEIELRQCHDNRVLFPDGIVQVCNIPLFSTVRAISPVEFRPHLRRSESGTYSYTP
jgi:hypothetical protein